MWIKRRRYRQTLRPCGQLPKFANGFRRHPDAWVRFDLHPIWQATQGDVECGDAFGLDTARAATSDEVKDLRREATALKEVVADLTLENRLLKKGVTADGELRNEAVAWTGNPHRKIKAAKPQRRAFALNTGPPAYVGRLDTSGSHCLTTAAQCWTRRGSTAMRAASPMK